ncbi:acyl-CoA dehydrogenase family protein [Nocardia sp. NPDC051030]|uniref:acyl-CoA dehydrogenase family protein n=1 Tax=Nocardia sp. NPDC051030 TaxID=3155162 RepID=UPI003434DC7E
MDFDYTEAQQDLSALARDLLTDWSARNPHPTDTGFDPVLWTALSRAGLLEAALPERAGGTGFGLLEQCAILTEIGRTVAPAPYSTTIAVSAAAIAEFGAQAQIDHWLPSILQGAKTMAAALAREAPAFKAVEAGKDWILNGSQSAVAAASFADAYLIEAHSAAGPRLFILDRTTPGLTVTEQHVVNGTDAGLLTLTDVHLPDQNRLSPDGAAEWTRRRATLATCAHQLGVLERALELTCEYARTRKQFDKPIGSFQAVRQRLADAHIDVEAVRLTLWQAAWRESHSLPAAPELSVAKYWSAQAAHRVAHTAVHIHASTGIYLDYPLHRYFTAAKRSEFESAPATTHLRHLGHHLASTPA